MDMALYYIKILAQKIYRKNFSRNNAKFFVSQKGIENQLVRHSRIAK